MPIRTQCPACQATLTVADSAAGKSIRCPSCQHVSKVATAARPSATTAAQTGRVPSEPQARAGSSERRSVKCPGCQATLRVPVGSQGKGITCPRCHKRFAIPGAATAQPTAARPAAKVAAVMPPAPLAHSPPGPLDDFDFGDLGTASPSVPTPYGAPAPAFATANPYAPRGTYARNFGPTRRSEVLYIIPGVIILLWGLLLVGITIFRIIGLVIVFTTREIPDGAIPYISGVVLGTIFISVIAGAMILGSIHMMRRTGLSNARTAAILALIPCFGGLVFPIGIWATVLLFSGSVKEDFSD